MGIGGFHIWHMLILLVVVLLVFGTGKLKNIGADLGNAVKGFREAMGQGEKPDADAEPQRIDQDPAQRTATGAQPTAKPAGQEQPRV